MKKQRIYVKDLASKENPENILAGDLDADCVFGEFLRTLNHIPNTLFNLSFKGITVVDTIFVKGVFGRICFDRHSHKYQGQNFYLSDVERDIQFALDITLSWCASQHGARNYIVPYLDSTWELALAGKYEYTVLSTFTDLWNCKTLTAKQVAERNDLSLNNASSRLKVLHDWGLCTRKELGDGTRGFIYHWLLGE